MRKHFDKAKLHIDKTKLRARAHWFESGPLHFGYATFVALEGHGFVSLFAGGIAAALLLILILGGWGGE